MDADLAGAVTEEFGGQLIGAAQCKLIVTAAQYLLPLVIGIPVLQARQILKYAAHADAPRADHADLPAQVGNYTAGCQLLAQYVNGDWQPAVSTVFIRITDELDKRERQKQGREEIKGAVLIGCDAEIGAGLLARQLHINFIMAGDLTDGPVLKHLQAAAQPDDNAAAHCIRGLAEQRIGRSGGMAGRQHGKEVIQLFLRVQYQQLIDLADIPALRWIAQRHIQHQRFQQVHLRGVPEMVALLAAGIFDDNVAEDLRHQLITLNLRQTVP